MTADPTADPPGEAPKHLPSTAGMTTKVVKGSLWTLAGQVAPLAVSLFTTPFVIRMLGAEGYGVFVLIGLIPTYLTFADLGMSMASTKFAAEACAEGNAEKEARIVGTAVGIILLGSIPIAGLMFIFSPLIVHWLNVPDSFLSEASTSLRIASITFVLTFLNTTFNTPQLVRLRMDLAAAITSGARICGSLAILLILYYGGGIVGAIAALLATQLLTLGVNILVSRHLVGHLFKFSPERVMIRPLLRFGIPLAISGIASILLVNLEKLVLALTTSVEALAYYSVAFTFASMATLYSTAMIQSLFPAFSQLMHPDKIDQLKGLFGRSLRMNILVILPALTTLLVIARPFLTIWAGPDFGREGTLPFYILLVGVFFNIIAFIPRSILMAAGKTDVFAKLYWMELVPYVFLVLTLTLLAGATGAALAWGVRCLADTLVLCFLAFRLVNFQVKKDLGSLKGLVTAAAILIPVIVVTVLWDENHVLGVVSLAICLIGYSICGWRLVLEEGERAWFGHRMKELSFR